MRYKLTLSYIGAGLSGWQTQPNAPTIQKCMQDALQTLLNGQTNLTGAGRTDAGVNAVGYIAHFDYPGQLPYDKKDLCYKLNAILPRQIVVHDISPEEDDFHARFDARKRTYKYFIHRDKDPFAERFSWQCPYTLDIDKMNAAACKILGQRDFSCFEKVGGANKTSICTISEAKWEVWTPTHLGLLGYPAPQSSEYLVFTVSADRFLRNMVRAIVGTLVEIGRGAKDVDWIDDVLQSGCRSNAGQSVPGHALFLCGIEY